MCLAIPGKVIEFMPETSDTLAMVEVSGVKRQVNVDLLREDGLAPGDWVLIHVGFAMSKISAGAAEEQMRMLQMLGEDLEAMTELEGYQFGEEPVS
jgi:hydrogenase expression/formation protein HypC